MSDTVLIADGPPREITISISMMDPGSIWLKDGQLGISVEDSRQFARGELSPERAQEIKDIVSAAANRLHNLDAVGVQFWMSPKRAMS